MDTIYYSLNAREVKVSGGPDLAKLVPAPAPVSAPAGEVLDFRRCRQKLETRAAFERMEDPAPEGEATAQILPAPQPRQARRARAAGILELCASAAVILVSLAAAAAFLSLI